MLTSSSSVAILAILMLSILYQGLPAFVPKTAGVKSEISRIEKEIEGLKNKLSNVPVAAKTGLNSQITELQTTLTDCQSRLGKIEQSFFTKPPAPDAHEAGIGPALAGSIWVCTGCAIFFLPLGVSTAIYLEEFKPKNKSLLWLSEILQLNISNLAGVPSIVYGILGLTAFASMFGVFGTANEPKFEIGTKFFRQYVTEGMQVIFLPTSGRDSIPELKNGMIAHDSRNKEIVLNVIGPDDEFPDDDATLNRSVLSDAEGGVVPRSSWYAFRLPLGRVVLAASLTLMLVILPVIIIASQEALRSVPSSLKQAALGLGCTPWQVVRHVTLPSAIPGIMTGSILAMSRAIGEAAPILMIAGVVYISAGPKNLMDDFSVLPLQIYYWAGQPYDPAAEINFQHVAAGGIIVLLLVLFAFNSIAVLIRQYAQKQLT